MSDHATATALVTDARSHRVLWHAINVMSRSHPYLADEYESHAWLAAWLAALKYDGPPDDAWRALLWISVKNALVSFRRSWNHECAARAGRPTVSTADVMTDNEDRFPADEPPVGWSADSEDYVRTMIGRAPADTRATLRVLFLECWDGWDDAAKRLGITRRQLNGCRSNGLYAIRRAIEWGEKGRAG